MISRAEILAGFSRDEAERPKALVDQNETFGTEKKLLTGPRAPLPAAPSPVVFPFGLWHS